MPLKPRDMERLVLKAGFILIPNRGKGDHRRYVHPDGRWTEIPFHSKELKPGTERAIRRQAGLK